MVWAKLDDEITDNEKIQKAGVLGFALHVAAITWSCRTLSDGFIPYGRVRLLLDFSTLAEEYLAAATCPPGSTDGKPDGKPLCHHDLGPISADKIAKRLVTVELWREDPTRGGYWIHDFLDYNPSREETNAQKTELSKVRAEAGKKGASSRWSSNRHDKVNAKLMAKPLAELCQIDGKPDGKPDGKGNVKPIAKPWQIDGPVPDPLNTPLPPVGGSGPDRVIEVGTAGAMEAMAAYERAISSVTGKPCALPSSRQAVGDLCSAVNAHCPQRDTPAALEWISATVTEWVQQHRERSQFTSGWAPKQFLNWLNAERPPPSLTVLRTGTDGGASPRSRRNLNDFQP